jgi:hypothetical protein
MVCVPWGNPGTPIGDPSYGYRSFDNVLLAWLAVFQYMTLTDYTLIMYDTQDGLSWWTWPLHITIVTLGGLVLVNLVLAVLYIQFTNSSRDSSGATRKRQLAHFRRQRTG